MEPNPDSENSMNGTPTLTRSPPQAVALSGIIFSALYFASLVILRLAVPSDPNDSGGWLEKPENQQGVRVALNLIPFTGIAFLWFMAVLRNRVGLHEDRFFSTVFLASRILFVALLFVSAAVSGGLLATFGGGASHAATSDLYRFGRMAVHALTNTFGMKMAAVFMFVTSTIGVRTGVLARWVSFVGFAMGLVLLLVISEFLWIALLFPIWATVVSVHILVASSGGDSRDDRQTPGGQQ